MWKIIFIWREIGISAPKLNYTLTLVHFKLNSLIFFSFPPSSFLSCCSPTGQEVCLHARTHYKQRRPSASIFPSKTHLNRPKSSYSFLKGQTNKQKDDKPYPSLWHLTFSWTLESSLCFFWSKKVFILTFINFAWKFSTQKWGGT